MDLSDLNVRVNEIIDDVARNGDHAIKKLTEKFDGIKLDNIKVTEEEIRTACEGIPHKLKKAIDQSLSNIMRFHTSQTAEEKKIETVSGVNCWQRTMPIQKIGLYIPGGSAPLLSTVLMLGAPARLAGCREIILCTPPGKDGKVNDAILYIASLLEIDKIFRVGGAQAIAAMAYGTETIPSVNKIFGPGNQFVTAAKMLVSMDKVAIDMPAGPSEVAIIADGSADPEFIAADLLSQAEHGADSQVLLFTFEERIIEKVIAEIGKQLERLTRKDTAEASLKNSKIILLDNQDEIMEMVNMYAPEHLIIATKDTEVLANRVINAGSVFLGNFTPESAGDYASGTNHTLPTDGWAHAYSGVNMDSFVRKITFQEISREGLKNISDTIITLAEAEGLDAHGNAVSVRINRK